MIEPLSQIARRHLLRMNRWDITSIVLYGFASWNIGGSVWHKLWIVVVVVIAGLFASEGNAKRGFRF